MDITRFCAKNDSRDYMNAPFRAFGFLYATNGHIAVRVVDDPEIGAPTIESDNPVIRLFDNTTVHEREWHPIKPHTSDRSCRCCHGTGFVTECPDCNGEGEFDHGSHTYECRECNGSGEVSASRGPFCSVCCGTGIDGYDGADVGHAHYGKRYLNLIAKEFPGAELGVPKDPEAVAVWRCGNVIGLLMPMRRGQ